MKGFGFLLLGAGLALTAFALLMSVAVGVPDAAMDGFAGGAVANADLMNQRLLFGVVGTGLFVSGWLALILDRLTIGERKAAIDEAFAGQV